MWIALIFQSHALWVIQTSWAVQWLLWVPAVWWLHRHNVSRQSATAKRLPVNWEYFKYRKMKPCMHWKVKSVANFISKECMLQKMFLWPKMMMWKLPLHFVFQSVLFLSSSAMSSLFYGDVTWETSARWNIFSVFLLTLSSNKEFEGGNILLLCQVKKKRG